MRRIPPIRFFQCSGIQSPNNFNYNKLISVANTCKPLLIGLNQCSYLTQNRRLNFSTKSDSEIVPVTAIKSKDEQSSGEDKSSSDEEKSSSGDIYEEAHALREAREDYYRTKYKIMQMNEADLVNTSVATNNKYNQFKHPESNFEKSWEAFEDSMPKYKKYKVTPEKGDPNDPVELAYNHTDQVAFVKQDIDLRPEAISRWWKRCQVDYEIKQQLYNKQRHSILGHDLAAAHFFVFRKGKVKFMGHPNWVTEYRTDAETEENEEDLPDMTLDVCTLPTSYDPNYLVEAIDCSNIVELRYEGLENLANLKFCTSLKFENCIHLDAWCMDRLASYFGDRLLYLDISGCKGMTEGALCAIARFRKLQTLVVRNIDHIRNKDLVCAWIEDMNPELEIVGTNYEEKLAELQRENELLDQRARELEASTITIEESTPRQIEGGQSESQRQRQGNS